MKYINSTFSHGKDRPRIGVLITNLGTPEKATTSALRKYLGQFLSDPRVVEVSRVIWWCALHFVILRIRPARSAKSYQKVWTERGSPLAFHTQDQARLLQEELKKRFGDNVVLDWAMRYGEPSIAAATERLMEAGIEKLLVLPLYPQYSATTTASTFDALAQDFMQRRWLPELQFVNSYHSHPAYIKAIADSIRAHWQDKGKQDLLLFSYHGIPTRYLHQGDPYHCQCLQSSRLIANELGLDENQYKVTFQSRFGREPWLEPYTDQTLIKLAKNGLQSVALICPGFSSDCLETIEEIDEENRHYFLDNGGKDFYYIAALNATEAHISALADICGEKLSSWQASDGNSEHADTFKRYEQCPFNKMPK